MQGDYIKLRGSIEMARHNAFNGEVIEKRHIKNTVVTAGRRWILDNIISGGAASAQVINNAAFGTSTSAPATSETALASEAVRKTIASFDTANFTSNPPSFAAQVTLATNEGNTTLGEAGLFNSSSAGTMLNRATFATIDKTTSNTLAVTFTISG
jgi:hypothetical protein